MFGELNNLCFFVCYDLLGTGWVCVSGCEVLQMPTLLIAFTVRCCVLMTIDIIIILI